MRRGPALVVVVLLAWLTPGAAVASPVSGAPSACGRWVVVPSPDGGSNPSRFTGVSATSKGDAWAVGQSFTGSVYRTLAAHWDGATWTLVPTPNVGAGTNALTSVTAISPTDAWAVGFYAGTSTFRTLALHWDGATWSIVPTPNLGSGANGLESVTSIGADDVWAVGYRQASSGSPRVTLAVHWDGSAWSSVPTPTGGTDESFLFGVAARSSTDVWAVGLRSVPWFQTLTEHWDGVTWTEVASPNLGDGNNDLSAVAIAGSQVVAVGSWLDGARTDTLTQRWNGSRWRVVTSPSPGADQSFLVGAAASRAGDAWAVGWQADGPGAAVRTLAEHWDGRAWTAAATPNVGGGPNTLDGVALVPGSTRYWAVGHSTMHGTEHTLTLSRC